MQNERSFSIVDEDDDFTYDHDGQSSLDPIPPTQNIFSAKRKSFNVAQVKSLMENSSDSEHSSPDRQLQGQGDVLQDTQSHIMTLRQNRIPSAGPSGRQTVTKIRAPILPPSTDSDSEHSDDLGEVPKVKATLPGEYNAVDYENLDVGEEISELFQYITKYIPQQLNLDFKFKPFIPEFLPAVGDIDAFLKVIPPESKLNGEPFEKDLSYLGLTVLDEPAANQSDPALLHLQLRASSVNVTTQNNAMVVKKITNIEKDSKTIDKWIKDISDLHKTKSSPIVKYSDLMPDLDDLMQQWPENMENMLKLHGFPIHCPQMPLARYVEIVCCMFDVPIYRNKIQSLHMLFSLYAAVKSVQQQQQSLTMGGATMPPQSSSSMSARANVDRMALNNDGTDTLLLD